MKINLLVIRTDNPEILKTQYEKLGFNFDYHQHGNGPFHYASEQDGFVFEIYPLTKSMGKADNSIRLGFEIQELNAKIIDLENSNWKIISEPKETEWGLTALIQDLDGRKIELKNK
ncbi:hypothetical protein [uncultured Aquimarina sp.]|uniref:VOC family protein n=1 Tax=uncultured Aquimarina sp. TaxID=575652 RepID=UPI002607C852|nr:hypothetical protein [uncultured Aquimarina sp.]